MQHEDLVPEREDLSVAGVTGGKDPADSCENETCERGDQVHESLTMPTSKVTLESSGSRGRMTSRQQHVWQPEGP